MSEVGDWSTMVHVLDGAGGEAVVTAPVVGGTVVPGIVVSTVVPGTVVPTIGSSVG